MLLSRITMKTDIKMSSDGALIVKGSGAVNDVRRSSGSELDRILTEVSLRRI